MRSRVDDDCTDDRKRMNWQDFSFTSTVGLFGFYLYKDSCF